MPNRQGRLHEGENWYTHRTGGGAQMVYIVEFLPFPRVETLVELKMEKGKNDKPTRCKDTKKHEGKALCLFTTATAK